MQKYQNNIAARNGDAVVGIKVLIKLAGTATPATIYSDDGITTTPNPLTTNANGYFEFYVANGLYDIAVSGVNTYTDVLIADALGIDADALKKTEAAATDGATKIGTPEGTVQVALDAREKTADLAANTGASRIGTSSGDTVELWLSGLPTVSQFGDLETQVDALTDDPANAVTAFFMPADQFRQTSGSGAVAGSVNTRLYAWLLPTGATTYLSGVIEYPSHWNSMNVDIVVANTAANAGNVTMGIEIQQWVIGDNINTSPAGQNRTVAADTVPHVSFAATPVNPIALTPGKNTTLRLSRQTSGDTLPNSIAFVGVRFRKAS